MYISPPDVHISKHMFMLPLQMYIRVSQQNMFIFENEKNDLFLWYLGVWRVPKVLLILSQVLRGAHGCQKSDWYIFSSIGDLVIESVIKFVSWLLISASFSVDNDYFDCIDYNDWNDYRDYIDYNDYSDYNDYKDYNDYSDYNDYNNYNDYRDSDLDLDWERFIDLVA